MDKPSDTQPPETRLKLGRCSFYGELRSVQFELSCRCDSVERYHELFEKVQAFLRELEEDFDTGTS